MAVKIYLCRSMSHRIKEDVVKEAAQDADWFRSAGLEVLDPVEKEQVKPTKERLLSSRKAMQSYWPADKEMIRQAHVILDMTPHLKSFGTEKEVGYARYHLWKKVIRVFPKGELPAPSCVAYLEDDDVVDSREAALESILKTHGSWKKRFQWRFSIYKRCWLRAKWYRIKEWFI